MVLNLNNIKAVYVVKPDYIDELSRELGDVSLITHNLVFSSVLKPDVIFAEDTWFDPVIIPFESISEAAGILRRAGKLWFLNPVENIRRSHLIAAELRKLPILSHAFPVNDALPDIGCFSLLDKNTLVYSTRRAKKPPLGDYQFIEDKQNPPNRAYLKLWEALTLLGHYPKPNETAIDLGASPGGWTYVMQTFGTKVIAVDKAPLEPRIAKSPRVQFLQQSAFALDPSTFTDPLDWVLCDVACYPERTLALIQRWIHAKKAKQLIFTIKLQGTTNLEILKQFKDIPGSSVTHLFHNKHEVTFFYPGLSTMCDGR